MSMCAIFRRSIIFILTENKTRFYDALLLPLFRRKKQSILDYTS